MKAETKKKNLNENNNKSKKSTQLMRVGSFEIRKET